MKAKEELKKVEAEKNVLKDTKASIDKFEEISDDALELVTGGSELNPRVVWVD